MKKKIRIGKTHKDRWGVAFAIFIVFFLAVIALIFWFICVAHAPLWENIVLAVCCAALAFIPALLFYLLYLKKIQAGTNLFLYDYKNKKTRDLNDIPNEEILERLRLYMDAAVSYQVDLSKSKYARWLNRHVGAAPANYYMFFIIRTFQIALQAETIEDADAFFLQVNKQYFDELVTQLFRIGADELAISVQYCRAIYPDDKEGVFTALRKKEEYLDHCLVHYVREHISEFTN
jgi:hypothetical protein